MLRKNQKLCNRILSFILALISVISLLPLQVFSIGEAQSEENDDAIVLTLEGEPVSELFLLPYEKREIRVEGAPEAASYQWQILHPKQEDLWVNIYDATDASLPVTMALVGNMLGADNTSRLRCRITLGDAQWYSAVLKVVMGEAKPEVVVMDTQISDIPEETDAPTEPMEIPEETGAPTEPMEIPEETGAPTEVTEIPEETTAPEIPEADIVLQSGGDTMLMAAAENVPEFVTVTINYYLYVYELQADGKTLKLKKMGEAFTPYVAALKSGSDLQTTVPCPTIVGYNAVLEDENGVETPCDEVEINLTNIEADVVYTVNYKPAEVDYEVRYFFQNIYDDLYVEDANLVKNTLGEDRYPISAKGETGTNPDTKFTHAEFAGFTSLYYEPEKIAADGSTVFHVYYERNYVLMEFDCNGGYGTDTLYVRYGTYISVPNPVRAGWVFAGWDLVRRTEEDGTVTDTEDKTEDELPATMPPYNTAYKALWTQADTTYSIAYWIVNDDGSRSYLGGCTVPGKTGDTVSGQHDLDDGKQICGLEAHTHSDECYICKTEEHNHTNEEDCFVDMTLAENHPGDNGIAAIKALEGGRNPEPGYIYVIYNPDSGTYWPKLYLKDSNGNGAYYVVNNTQGGNTEDSFSGIIDGGSIGSITGTYGNETLTVTKYKPKTTCGKEQHIHNDACRTCREHDHSDACYQSERHLEPVYIDEEGNIVETETYPSATVLGDGSTVVNVYYKYKTYIIRYVYARGKKNANNDWEYAVSTSTLNGALNTVEWSSIGSTLPVFTDPDTNSTNAKYFERDGYRYYYVSVTGQYGEDISNEWPAKNDVKITYNGRTFTWGSWAAENGTEYRQNIGQHANVVGSYPTLSEEMISSAPEQLENNTYVAQNMIAWWSTGNQISAHAYHNYFEVLPKDIPAGEIGNDPRNPTEYNGNYYIKTNVSGEEKVYLLKNDLFVANHDGWTHVGPFEFIGFEWIDRNENLTDSTKFPNYGQCSICSTNCYYCNIFYFDRSVHSLKFWNYNGWLGEGKGAGNTGEGSGVRYGTPMNVFGEYVTADFMKSHYPDGLEPGAYEFERWYTTAQCLPDTEVLWDTMTMPDSDLTLYAKWNPVVHDVYFYYDYEDYTSAINPAEVDKDRFYWYYEENGEKRPDSYPIEVTHGNLLETAYNNTPTPEEGYTFVGWFYIDETGKKRFAPDTMEVKQDLHLFAEWKSGIDTQYTVNYVLEDDGTVIAAPTTGHLTAGKTKTFTAKVGPELYEAYQEESLFPLTNSHSILMSENSTENVYTFRYEEDDNVLYRVRYLNKVTKLPLHRDKTEESTKAIVTEKFVPITGFLPESYYIRKVLAHDGSATEPTEQNEIIFYYTPDETHGPFVIEYYTQVLGGSGNIADESSWELEQSEIGMADLDQTLGKEIDKDKFDGFTYRQATVTTYDTDGNAIVSNIDSAATSVSGKVTQNGLEIRIFYTREDYDYVIEFVEYGTNKVLGYGHLDQNGDPVTNTDGTLVFETAGNGQAQFESIISYTAPDTISKTEDGETTKYIFYATDEKPQTQDWTIRASNTVTNDGKTERTENVLTFYYQVKKVGIIYNAVCTVPDAVDYGIVDLNYEQAASVKTLSGSNAVAGIGFEFKGWFTDPGCTTPVDTGWRFDPGPTHSADDDKQSDTGTKLKPRSLPDANLVNYYALFAPVKENLRIKKEGENLGDDTFLFRVTGKDVLGNQVNLIVSIQGAGNVTIKDLYCGSYTVTELTDWSWTYTCSSDVSQTVTLTTEDKDGSGKLLAQQITTYDVTFRNVPRTVDWLHGESAAAENQFTIAAAP